MKLKSAVRHILCLLAVSLIMSVAVSAAAPVCSKCRRAIHGTVYKLGNFILCEDDAPRCRVCGKICTGRFYTNSSGYLCEEDFQRRAPVCYTCGNKILEGRRYLLRDNIVICESCRNDKSLPRCFVCNAPIMYQGLKFSDGRVSCRFHAEKAVVSQDQMPVYLARAWQLIGSYADPSIKVDPRRVSIYIVDKYAFNSKIKTSGLLGDVHGLTIGYRGGRSDFHIYIIQGLPPDDTLTTVVHECGHVWQMFNAAGNLDSLHKEGFCEWLSYKVNKGLGHAQQVELLEKKKDNVYGKGLRYYLEIEKRGGVQGVLQEALGKGRRP